MWLYDKIKKIPGEVYAVAFSLVALATATHLATRPSKLEKIVQQPQEKKLDTRKACRELAKPQFFIPSSKYISTEDVVGMADVIQYMQMPALRELDWKELAKQYPLEHNRQLEEIPSKK